jgi:cytidine deaminase
MANEPSGPAAAHPPLAPDQEGDLAQHAARARAWAYAPYSGYHVGAALLTASGKVYDGVNVENAAYPATICAERAAVVKAVSEGEREFVAIAVASSNGGSPCGSCRQVLAEFSLAAQVLIVDPDGRVLRRTTVADLLPDSFGPRDLA